MKTRLIALDIDGTLLDDAGRLPPDNVTALKTCADRGIIIALASGRMFDCITPTARALGIDCALIGYNGAKVQARMAEARETVCHDPLPAAFADTVVAYCREHSFQLNYYLDDVLYSRTDPALRKYSDLYSAQTGARYSFVDSLDRFQGRSPTKLILITDPSHRDATRTRDHQYEYFSTRLPGDVYQVKTNPEYLEFLHRGADKGAGLHKLAEFYGVQNSDTVAFGDGENDVEMLAGAGTGVALANAKERTKRAAHITLEWNNNQAGVARYLEKQGLGIRG